MPLVQVSGEKLSFIEKGSGPAIVLLHGIGARADLWMEVIDQLADRYNLRAFDLRGHGGSTCNQGLSIDGMTSDVLEAAEQLGLASFHLVGVSIGGAVALRIAATAPERVRSLVVGGIGLDSAKALADEIYGIREAVHYLLPEDFSEQVSGDLLGPDASPERAGALASSIMTLTKQRYLQALEAIAASDLGSAAAQVKTPALVLHGELDDFITTTAADALARAMAGARRAEVPDAGHLANIDNPEAFAIALADFIAA